jgi:hypothetical protein
MTKRKSDLLWIYHYLLSLNRDYIAVERGHLTIQQCKHLFHPRLLNAVPFQSLFVSLGMGRHHPVTGVVLPFPLFVEDFVLSSCYT